MVKAVKYSLTGSGWFRIAVCNDDDVGQLLCALTWHGATTQEALLSKFRLTNADNAIPEVVAQHTNIADNLYWHLQRALELGYIAVA